MRLKIGGKNENGIPCIIDERPMIERSIVVN